MSAIRLEADGSERILPASELKEGDRVLIKPGHGVPGDGIIEDGESSLDGVDADRRVFASDSTGRRKRWWVAAKTWKTRSS